MPTRLKRWVDSLEQGIAFLKPIVNPHSLTTTFVCQHVNTALAELLGTTPDQLREQPLDPFVRWASPNQWNKHLQLVFQTGQPWEQTLQMPTTNRWFRLRLSRLDDELVVSLQPGLGLADKPSADALQQTNQLLQAVIQTSPTGLALLRPIWQHETIIDFQYLLNNPQSALITGLAQETMLGNRLLVLFPHLRGSGVFSKMVQVANTGQTQRFELLDELPSGAFWGDFTLSRVSTDVLFSVQDITHRKQIEEKLRQTNQDLEQHVARRTDQVRQLAAFQRAILTHAGMGIAATDTQGIIQLVNPAMEALTGYQARELVGQVTPGFLRDPVVHQHQLEELKKVLDDPTLASEEVMIAYMNRHAVLRRENTLLTKEGQRVPVLATVSGLYDEQNELMGFVDIAMDISPLKKVETALIQAQQRSQLARQAARLRLWEWNLATHTLELEDSFFSDFDMPNSAEIYRIGHVLGLAHPADLPLLRQVLGEVNRGKRVLDFEFRVWLPATRTLRFLKVDGQLLPGEPGSAPRMVGVVADRTRLRQAQSALQASEHRYRTLVSHIKMVVFQTDTTGLWTYLNPAWETLTGFSVEESLGTRFLEYVLVEDQARNQEQFVPLVTRQKAYCRHEIRYRHRSGGYRWVEVFAQLTLDEQDQVMGTTGTLTDITERKKVEETLRESEQRFREIAENVDELFWIREVAAGGISYINPVFETFTGIPVEEVYRNPMAFFSAVIPEDQPLIAVASQSQDVSATFQFRIRHQTGRLRWLTVRTFSIFDENGRLTRRIGVATDTTALIEKGQILEESLRKERALTALQSQFITTASHEFRTPLTAISSSVELLQHYLGQLPAHPVLPGMARHLTAIFTKVQSLNTLIGDTLTISKLDEGQIKVSWQALDVVDFCQSLIQTTFADRPDSRRVELRVLGMAQPYQMDPKLLGHILVNLLGNAFKFSTQNPTLTIRFGEAHLELAVSDRGIGIPADELSLVFSKFFRARNAAAYQGTGLGLGICQDYASLLGGALTVSSQQGVGTRFTLNLPFQKPTLSGNS